MNVLIIAEHEQVLKPATRRVVSAAKELTSEITILVIGSQCKKVAEEAALILGVSKVLLADNEVYAAQLAENSAMLVAELAKNFAMILAPGTTFGKNLLPRVAALLDIEMLSDVIQIIDAKTFVRPIYAGNAVATVQSEQARQIMTIRPTAFADILQQQTPCAIEMVDKVYENLLSTFIGMQATPQERPDLTAARVVISGGRGLQSAENFHLLEKIADHLNAAIGASRAAVDAGYAPNDYQVGQTGKVVAPELYIAVGISGAIQHIAGIKDSRVIVAINKDPDAPIFQISDYGLVGDLFEILPELESKLAQLKSSSQIRNS